MTIPHCQDLLATMSDYVDGSLTQSLCQALEKHLADCGECRVVVNTLRKTLDLYQPDVPSALPPRVRDRLYLRLSLADFNFRAPLHAEPGELCPNCAQAEMDYDGMLNLVCPACGWTEAGCST